MRKKTADRVSYIKEKKNVRKKKPIDKKTADNVPCLKKIRILISCVK